MTVARPKAVEGWPVEKVAGIECLFDRGISTVRISHETGYPQTVLRDFRDWYSRNGQLWPGPREVALALCVACAFTDENPVDVLTTPGTSRGRAYAFWALRRAYPGLPRVTLAKMLGCRPFGTTTDRYVEGFVNRYSMDRPADAWWSTDNAQVVAAELSQKPTYGPLPSWFGARDKKLAADFQPPVHVPRRQPETTKLRNEGNEPENVAQDPKPEPWRSSHPMPAPRPAPVRVPTETLPAVIDEPTDPVFPDAVIDRALEPVVFLAKVDLDDLQGAALAHMKLRHDQCRWPFGVPKGRDFRFCEATKPEGESYCAEHRKAASGGPGKSLKWAAKTK